MALASAGDDNVVRLFVNQGRRTVSAYSNTVGHNYTPLDSEQIATPSAGKLNANVLRRIDPDNKLSRLLDLIAKAIGLLEGCLQELKDDKNFDADDSLLAVRPVLTEIFMFREGRDSLGLIISTAIKAIAGSVAVTANPELPKAVHSALLRLNSRPSLSFEEAIEVADTIEASCAESVAVPGYNVIADVLINESSGNADRVS